MGASRFTQKQSRLRESASSSSASSSSKKLYVVETIIKHRGEKGLGNCIEYLVKWQNYMDSANSWEPYYNLTHSPEMVAQYWEKEKRMQAQNNRPRRKQTYQSKKEAKGKLAQLSVDIGKMVAEETGSVILSWNLLREVAKKIEGKDSSQMAASEIDSLSKRIGKALKEAFQNSPVVWKTHKLGPKNQQRRYYKGLKFVHSSPN